MARKKIDKKPPKQPAFDDLSPHAKQAIAAVIVGIIGVFFLFTLFQSAGPLGTYTEVALRYLFGSGAWLAPVGCFLYIYVLMNPKENNQVSTAKILGTVILFFSIFGALELSEHLGGVFGWALAWPLITLLGAAVSGILLFGTFLISIFLIFNTGIKLPSLSGAKNLLKDVHGDDTPDEELEDFDDIKEEPQKSTDTETEEEDSSPSALSAIVSTIAKTKPNDIVVKNFSGTFVPPSLSLLNKENGKPNIGDVKANANTIKRTLKEFGISVEMDAVESGPTILLYALKPAQGPYRTHRWSPAGASVGTQGELYSC